MTARFEVQVTGRLHQALTAASPPGSGRSSCATVLNGKIADQAALRSLLGLIWDTGCTLLDVTVHHDTASR
jgi:hypothetical protein